MTTLWKKLVRKLAVAATFAIAAGAQADPVTWTLNNVTFTDGTSLQGWFVWDASATTNKAGAFWFKTSDGDLTGTTYDGSSTGGASFKGNPAFSWQAGGDSDPYLYLFFKDALTDAGGTVDLAGATDAQPDGNGAECSDVSFCAGFRYVEGGSVTGEAAQAVPEPASIALLGAGLVGLGLGLARRRKTA